MVAANMGIELASLEVEIEADWDARGTWRWVTIRSV